MLKMCYIVTYGPWLSKQSLKMIHFKIIIKSTRHFLGSLGVCGSVRGPYFTRRPRSVSVTVNVTVVSVTVSVKSVTAITALWLCFVSHRPVPKLAKSP